jgi:hypothetical protein
MHNRHTNHTVAHGTLTHYSRNPSTQAPVTTGRQFRFVHNKRQSTHQPHCGPRNTYPLQHQSQQNQFAHNRRQSTHQSHCDPLNTYPLQPQSVHTSTSHNRREINSRTIAVSRHTNHTAAHGTLTRCSRNPRAPVTTGRQIRFAHNHRCCACCAASPPAFCENPIIWPAMINSTNVNGPSLIAMPSWVSRPLGRYYLYLTTHGQFHSSCLTWSMENS